MDHHCPWINNCVGLYTMKPFLLFTLYLSFLCFFGFLVVLYNILLEFEANYNNDQSNYNPFAFFKLKSPWLYVENYKSNIIFLFLQILLILFYFILLLAFLFLGLVCLREKCRCLYSILLVSYSSLLNYVGVDEKKGITRKRV